MQVFPNGTMIIRKVDHEFDPTGEYGKYTCIARNDKGDSARSNLQVTVMSK